MKRVLLVISAFILLLVPALSEAYIGLCCGKCGGNMPLNIVGGGVPETHEFRVKIQPSFMRMEGLRDGTDSVSGASLLGGMPASYMAVPAEMDMWMTNLALGYSFADDIFGGVMLMWHDKKMRMDFGSMMKMSTGVSGFTMESSGMGDTMLMGKYRLFTDDPLLPTRQSSLYFGLSVPTGSIDEKNSKHPSEALSRELLPYGMQLGSGTFDPTVGLLYQGSSSPVWWGANLLYTGRFYDNKRDYRLGDEVSLDIYALYQLRYDTVLELQFNAESRGSIRGEMDEVTSTGTGKSMMTASGFTTSLWDPDNYGGEKVILTTGIQWQPLPLHILNLQFGVPVYQNLNGTQLEEDYRVTLTWYVELPTKKSRRYGMTLKPEKSKLGF